jgi:hypothetical protein
MRVGCFRTQPQPIIAKRFGMSLIYLRSGAGRRMVHRLQYTGAVMVGCVGSSEYDMVLAIQLQVSSNRKQP